MGRISCMRTTRTVIGPERRCSETAQGYEFEYYTVHDTLTLAHCDIPRTRLSSLNLHPSVPTNDCRLAAGTALHALPNMLEFSSAATVGATLFHGHDDQEDMDPVVASDECACRRRGKSISIRQSNSERGSQRLPQPASRSLRSL